MRPDPETAKRILRVARLFSQSVEFRSLGFVRQVCFRGGAMIRFQCPHCGAKLQVSETHAEKEGPCPRCQKRLKVPPAPEPELELVKDEATDTAPIPSKLLDQVAAGPRPLPVGQDSDSPEDGLAQRLYDALGRESASEHTGARHLPWPLDVLLYPASIGGLTTLIILVGIPFLIGLVPMFGLAGWLIRVAINLYSAWYLAECVYDSAKGGTRAPMTLDTTDLDIMWSRVLYLTAVYLLFVFPAGIYYSVHTNLVDAGWQRQTESSELADGVDAHTRAIGKLTLAAATHRFKVGGVLLDVDAPEGSDLLGAGRLGRGLFPDGSARHGHP